MEKAALLAKKQRRKALPMVIYGQERTGCPPNGVGLLPDERLELSAATRRKSGTTIDN